jgi:hypothetical protein
MIFSKVDGSSSLQSLSTDKWDSLPTCHLITDDIGNRFILQSSLRVRHIAVPAAMKIAVPKANPEFSCLWH